MKRFITWLMLVGAVSTAIWMLGPVDWVAADGRSPARFSPSTLTVHTE
jgi:hypothetical protein